MLEDFYIKNQVTDISVISLKKVLGSYKVPCNNRKDWGNIVSYQVDGETIILTVYQDTKD